MALSLFSRINRRPRSCFSLLVPGVTYYAAAAMASATGSPKQSSCHALFNSPANQIGLGTYLMEKSQVRPAIRSAIEIGYRRIDTAPVYFNEDAVGDALQEAFQDGIVERKDMFITSKLPSSMHRHVELAVRKSLSDLRLEYLDLYLIHWPVAFEYNDNTMINLDKRGYDNEDIDDSGNGSKIDPTVSIHETW
jgi:diketogulonate reductase-like aldo/keto reductase